MPYIEDTQPALGKGPHSEDQKPLAHSQHQYTSHVTALEMDPAASVRPSHDRTLANILTVASRDTLSQKHPAKLLPKF